MTDQDHPMKQDIANALVRAGISLVPGGSAINELLNLVITPSIAERNWRWLEALDHDLSRLREKVEGFKLDDLKQREGFTSSFLQATRIAVTTHREEKLEALRNALLNIAVGSAPDDDTQSMFIARIEVYAPWHIHLLKLFDDPEGCARKRKAEDVFNRVSAGGMSIVLEAVFPELKGKRNFYDRVVGELERDGLLDSSGLHVTMTNQGLRQRRTSDLGRQFLCFVSTPKELQPDFVN